MKESVSKEIKVSPDGSLSGSESPKVTQRKNGQTIVLVPQPNDDPEDPLVRTNLQSFEGLRTSSSNMCADLYLS